MTIFKQLNPLDTGQLQLKSLLKYQLSPTGTVILKPLTHVKEQLSLTIGTVTDKGLLGCI